MTAEQQKEVIEAFKEAVDSIRAFEAVEGQQALFSRINQWEKTLNSVTE